MSSTRDFSGPTLAADPTVLADRDSSGSSGSGATGSTELGPALIAGRYELLGMLGAGGMGTVYCARDRELDEVVALKVVRREFAASPTELERFRLEVKLARRVTHRNVARTFDIGDHGGERFLTMEYVEGEALAARLAREGRLSVADTVSIAREICAGLAAAHGAGIVHRDLKPENVLLARDGRVVITDFGIARAFAEGEQRRTAGIVGTPAYMAPEQVEGVLDLDARADLYALGAILFELVTGRVAWGGDSIITIAAGRLLRPPPDLRELTPEVSPAFGHLVLKLMARRREDRFATASEVSDALAAVVGPGASIVPAPIVPARSRPAPQRSIAVLPLLNLSDPKDDYVSACLTEDLTDLLSVVPELRVRPRAHAARFADPSRDPRDCGRVLGVDVVVDGSVRRIADDLARISVRLITVEDGFQLWARRFDRAPGAAVAVADDASVAIARALAARSTRDAPRVDEVGDPIAQDLYLRGRYLMHAGWDEVAGESVGFLREAARRLPHDARIAGTLANALARLPETENTEARDFAARALALDPCQPEAHAALGLVHLANAEGPQAAAAFRQALVNAPNNVDALDSSGRLLAEVGRVSEALKRLHDVLAIDPSRGPVRVVCARAHALRGEWDAVDDAFGAIPTHPGHAMVYILNRARLWLWSGEADQPLAMLQVLPTLPLPPGGRRAAEVVMTLAATRQSSAETRVTIDQLLALDSTSSARRLAFHAQLRAELSCFAGDDARVIAEIETADRHALLDRTWLEQCPLLERVRPRVPQVRANVARRADEVLAAFDAPRQAPRPEA